MNQEIRGDAGLHILMQQTGEKDLVSREKTIKICRFVKGNEFYKVFPLNYSTNQQSQNYEIQEATKYRHFRK